MARQRQMKKSSNRSQDLTCCRILESTTDLAAIKGRRVLVLLDEQNLTITAQNLGYVLQYNLLAERIHAAADSAELHIFVAANPDDHDTKQRFENLGYMVHTKTIRRWHLPDGGQRCNCNVDNLFAFWAGLLAVKNSHDVIVLASGDYGLAGELAEVICEQHGNEPMQIMTLSLPGSTAHALDAHKNQNITANLEIGLDLLKPLSSSVRQFPARALGSYRTPTSFRKQ